MSEESLIIGARPEVRFVELDGLKLQVFIKRGLAAAPNNWPEAQQQLAAHDLMLNHLVRDYEACRAYVTELERKIEALSTLVSVAVAAEPSGNALDLALKTLAASAEQK